MKNKTMTVELEQESSSNQLKKLITYYISKNALKQERTENKKESTRRKIDPQVKRLLTYLFVGTRGGINRLRIMLLLAESPLNTHQLAKKLGLDYNAIQFHIDVLEKNNMITRVGERYGAVFFLSTFLEFNIDAFNEIVQNWKKF